MLGQSKTCFQAEIDAACELIDFWRFNVHFARQILADQPISSPGVWNRSDYRPLEGFVYAITPFNFTAIAGNLPTAPALMGNVVIWKPAHTQMLAASLTMDLLIEAGLPAGVINLVPGDAAEISDVALTHPDLAGIHFTGSTGVFQHDCHLIQHGVAFPVIRHHIGEGVSRRRSGGSSIFGDRLNVNRLVRSLDFGFTARAARNEGSQYATYQPADLASHPTVPRASH
jgi:hypothetical protein